MTTNSRFGEGLYLGLFCHGSHDAAVAIIDSDGKLLFAAEQERFDRIKHSAAFPKEVILSAFRELQITWDDIVAVGFAWSPRLSLAKAIKVLALNPFHLKEFLFRPKQNTPSRISKFKEMMEVKNKLKELGWSGKNFSYLNHHKCHAASSYFLSGFESALCLTVDGNGEIDSTTIHHFSKGRRKKLFEKKYPQSLGHFYATITQFLGFKPMNDEYKVMGLASFNREGPDQEILNKMKKILEIDSSYRINESFFSFQKGQDQMWSPEMESLLGEPRKPKSAIQERDKNIATSAQLLLEEALLSVSKLAHSLVPEETNLCMAGGVALNCVANERLIREGGWENVFIPPSPHDSGSAVGAAYLVREKFKSPFTSSVLSDSAYLGSKPNTSSSLKPGGAHRSLEDSIPWLATQLSQGKIVAWCRGRAEFGPRALGSRSVLADPRTLASKEKLNLIIKKRESFRPFAPIVIESAAEKYFDMGGAKTSPFMLRTVPALKSWKEKIPAACHIDGSARVQTLANDINPSLFYLLQEFEKITEIPILLNTSMNQSEEPIVNSAEEAVRFFHETEVDILVLENDVWQKQ